MTRVYFVRHAQPEHDWEDEDSDKTFDGRGEERFCNCAGIFEGYRK
ncbi:MAG: hypothetical protein ACLRIT_10515 [Blautia sp.]